MRHAKYKQQKNRVERGRGGEKERKKEGERNKGRERGG